jgi:hypothetical protein
MIPRVTLGRRALLRSPLLHQPWLPPKWLIDKFREERLAYHNFGWLTSNLISTTPDIDVPIIHDSTIIYFESYLIVGPGLPPSKFLSSIMKFFGYELVHFNPNAIAALSCFAMLYE